jgi:hypothetical protein
MLAIPSVVYGAPQQKPPSTSCTLTSSMSFIGALPILNLWLGLYDAAGEWPRNCFLLLTLEAIFALHQYGKSLGLGAIIVQRYGTSLAVRMPRPCGPYQTLLPRK